MEDRVKLFYEAANEILCIVFSSLLCLRVAYLVGTLHGKYVFKLHMGLVVMCEGLYETFTVLGKEVIVTADMVLNWWPSCMCGVFEGIKAVKMQVVLMIGELNVNQGVDGVI